MDKDNLRELIETLLPEGVSFDDAVSEFEQILEVTPVEELESLRTADVSKAELEVRAELAREDSPDGFRHFCFCITGLELPEHAFYCWIVPTYYSHGDITEEEFRAYYEDVPKFRYVLDFLDKADEDIIGCVIYAAREMAKTTYNTVLWTAFRIGQEPWKSNIIVQIGDTSAKANTAKIADIIENYAGWKAVFPSVRPHKDKSWSASGYEVIDQSLDSEEWDRRNAVRQDVTLAGYGYNSGVLIGKHPTGVLIIDDIHNENNTQSQVEMDKTLKIVQGTIFYCATDTTWVTFVGTPWIQGDTLDFVSLTDQYYVVKTPAYFHKVYNEIAPGEYEVQYSIADKWDEEAEKEYMWPEERGSRWVRRKQKATIISEFKRMVLLTISMSELQLYTYSNFPAEEIDLSWPQVVGVDPVQTVALVQGVEAGVSHFAMVMGLENPVTGGLVIAGADIEKIDLEAGERKVVQRQRQFPRARFSIETNNAGAAFIALINRSGTSMNWEGYNTSEIGGGNKENRQYTFLQPLFKNGLITVSDEDTPGLNIVRNYLEKFGLFKFANDAPELDAGDAIVMMAFACPHIWTALQNPVDPRELWLKRYEEQKREAQGLDALASMVQNLNRG